MHEGKQVAAFSVQEWLQRAAGHRVSISKPQQVQCWTKTSVNDGGQYLYGDTSGLAVFSDPPRNANLTDGYPQAFIRKPDGEATPVETIIAAAEAASLPWSSTNVCSFRNNLNKLCMTPALPDRGWVVDATTHGSTLFLDIVKTPEATFPNADRFQYYGYKFEALCTGATQPGATIDSTSEFAVVVQLALGRHNVLMAAEVDCREAAGGSEGGVSYVELKTFSVPSNNTFRAKMVREKYPQWWVQSFLAGVPTIVAGGREREGILIEVNRMSVVELPAEAKAAGQPFDAHQMLAFGDAILDWMAALCYAHQGQHMRFTYNPNMRVVEAAVVEHGPLPARLHEALLA